MLPPPVMVKSTSFFSVWPLYVTINVGTPVAVTELKAATLPSGNVISALLRFGLVTVSFLWLLVTV